MLTCHKDALKSKDATERNSCYGAMIYAICRKRGYSLIRDARRVYGAPIAALRSAMPARHATLLRRVVARAASGARCHYTRAALIFSPLRCYAR